LLQKFQGFLILEFQADFPSLCNAKFQGFIILEFPRHIHTYILSIEFAQTFYFLWISVVMMKESGVPLLDCICIGGTAVFQSRLVFFFFVCPCSGSELLWGKQMKN
jgi:hypothetical protein